MVVHQHAMWVEVVHRVGAVDPAAGSDDGTGQGRDGAGGARRGPVGQGGRRRLRLQLEHLPRRGDRDRRPGTGRRTRTRRRCSGSTKPGAEKPSGRPAPQTGARRWVDRWDTGLVDITGTGGSAGAGQRPCRQTRDRLARPSATRHGGPASNSSRSTCRRPTPRPAREALPHAG